jgi:peptide/nickel transport system permease protein
VLKLIFKRIGNSLILLFILITFLFFLLRLAPGDPALKFISPYLSKSVIEEIRARFMLDAPLIDQYIAFVKNALMGDFGISYQYQLPVTEVIMLFFPVTLILAGVSFILQIGLSLSLVVFSYRKHRFDKFISKVAVMMFALPSFLLAILLVYFFSGVLNILPSSGLRSSGVNYGFFQSLWDYLRHLILPIATLSLSGTAVYYKYLRDNIQDVRKKNYILNLRGNGVDENIILFRHIIPNAAIPLIAIAGIEMGILLGGALITEVIFGLPGMGRLTVNAILYRDYPLIIGAAALSAFFIIISNLAADIIKAGVDKRLRAGIE